MERYDKVIQDVRIVKRVSCPANGNREVYIPHKGVVREASETTKFRVFRTHQLVPP